MCADVILITVVFFFFVLFFFVFFFFFFFQAEDGIRDVAVTGVQTCALPISRAAQGDRISAARLRHEREGKKEITRILAMERLVGRPEVPRGVPQLRRGGETGEVGDPVGQGPVRQARCERLSRLGRGGGRSGKGAVHQPVG